MAEFEVVEHREWVTHMRDEEGGITGVVNTWDRSLPSEEDFNELFVTTAAPTRVTPSRRKKPAGRDTTAFIIPDVQIGYRGEETFHDERVIKLGLTALHEVQPDEVILIGDTVDLPSVSRWPQDREWVGTVQKGIDRTHELLAQVRSNAPNARVHYLAGNHEKRLEDYVKKNAAELLGLKRANSSSDLGVLAMQNLLRTGELEVDYHAGYPNADLWLEDDLRVSHGVEARRSGQTARAYLGSAVVSTVFGHSHRIESAQSTLPTRDGHKVIQAASFGTWSRIDGSVPHGSQSFDEEGQHVPRAMNWQNSAGGIVQHNERRHNMQVIPLDSEGFTLWGRRYED